MHLHAGLTVRCRGEDFALACRDRGVALDELREDAPERLDAEAERGHVEEEDVLHLAAEDRALDRRAERDALHRVHAALRRPPEDLLEPLAHDGHAGRAPDEDHMVDVGVLPAGVLERLADRAFEASEDRLDELLELRAGQLLLEVKRPAVLLRDERQVDRRLGGRGQLDLRLLPRIAEALHRLAVPGEVHAVVLSELRDEPLDEVVVHVHAAERGVA